MEYTRSPLRIAVRFAASKGPVRVINTAAYIYRRSVALVANDQPYWRPNGNYFVRYGGSTFPVSFDGNGFYLKLGIAEYLRMLTINKEKVRNGSNRKPTATEIGG